MTTHRAKRFDTFMQGVTHASDENRANRFSLYSLISTSDRPATVNDTAFRGYLHSSDTSQQMSQIRSDATLSAVYETDAGPLTVERLPPQYESDWAPPVQGQAPVTSNSRPSPRNVPPAHMYEKIRDRDALRSFRR